MEEGTHHIYKIIIVGDSGVGKTNLLACFAQAQESKRHKTGKGNGSSASFSKLAAGYSENHQPTIGCEFYSTIITHPTDGSRIQLQLWDTAGQERYHAISTGHYRKAAGVILVYDVSNKDSFKNALEYWYHELEEWPCAECIMLVGNKIDLLREAWTVSLEEHNKAARDLMLRGSTRTSAKTGENVSDTFMKLIYLVHEQNKLKKGNGSNYDNSVSLNYMKTALEGNDEDSGSKGCECG